MLKNFETRYMELAEVSSQILSQNMVASRMAMSTLHVRNAHPSSLEQYADYFNNQKGLFKQAQITLKSHLQKYLSLFRNEPLYFGDDIEGGCDILFISHFTNESQASESQDTYYGILPDQLNKLGLKSVVAQINHLWTQEKDIKSKWKKHSTRRVILSRTIDYGSECSFIKQLKREACRIRHTSQDAQPKRRIAKHCNRYSLLGTNIMALRTAQQVQELVKKLKPKIVVTTFEGHAWERLVYRVARNVDPEIKCIGYHHAIIFPLQFALGKKYGNAFDPDGIMTAGKTAFDWFSGQKDWRDTEVEILGSARTPKVGIANEPKESGACLVAPEGLVSESVLLFTLAVQAARVMPNQEFKLRLHPVISRSTILRSAPHLKKLPNNVTWSNSSLDEDFEISKFILYRGSTVAISATLCGLQPIYYSDHQDKVSIDPLADLNQGKEIANSHEALVEILKKIENVSIEEQIVDAGVAKRFCENYFHPISLKRFVEFSERLKT